MDERKKMWHVTYWETKKIYRSFEKLAIAKKYARGMGHTGEDIATLTGYPPIAFVANDEGECVYNPHFSKKITSALGLSFGGHDDFLRG